MRRLFMLVGLALVLQSYECAAAESVGKVESLSGKVTAGTRTLAARDAVFQNDRIVTGPGARAQLRFLDNTLVSVGERSELVINEYVYAPDRKEDNRGFFTLVGGVFRFITDKITKLNPERFEVKANYGTIGIRGCDLGFRITRARDEIYVIALESADHVVVTPTRPSGGGPVIIRDNHTLIQLSGEDGVLKRPFQTREMRFLESGDNPEADAEERTSAPDDVGPLTSGNANPASSGQPAAPVAGGETPPASAGAATRTVSTTVVPSSVPGGASVSAGGASSSSVTPINNTRPIDQDAQAVNQQLSGSENGNGGQTGGNDASGSSPSGSETSGGSSSSGNSGESSFELVSGGDSDSDGDKGDTGATENSNGNSANNSDNSGNSNNGNSGKDEDEEDDDSNGPVISTGAKVTMDSGAGADWSWGVWARPISQSSKGQHTIIGYEIGSTSSGKSVSQTALDLARLSAVPVNLSGRGKAGALVAQGSSLALLQGGAQISVQMGLLVSPTWQGSFSMGNGSDSLQFTVPGTVSSKGALSGNPSSYSLTAFGASYGLSALTKSDITGKLVGKGNPLKPISGAVVEFGFEHGSGGPKVAGAGGADF